MADVQIRRFLHCNYNCVDVDRLEQFYTAVLGLKTVMRTENAGLDEGLAFGMYGETASKTAFVYDHRGGRYSNSLELIQWLRPETFGDVYPGPWYRGMQSMGYTADDLDLTAERVVANGGTIERRGETWMLFRDPEQLPVEVVATPGPSQGRYVRIVCTDVDETSAWFQSMGFAPGELTSIKGSDIWPADGERAIVTEQALVASDDPSFGLLLTGWSGPQADGPSYAVPFHRGLFRMALAVDDIFEAHAELTRRAVARQLPHTFQLPGTPLTSGLTILFMRSPDGVVVELVERPRVGRQP
jgi:catechol 2,3-dioxygenase-like lactoylglutathione lyase family enzyme